MFKTSVTLWIIFHGTKGPIYYYIVFLEISVESEFINRSCWHLIRKTNWSDIVQYQNDASFTATEGAEPEPGVDLNLPTPDMALI